MTLKEKTFTIELTEAEIELLHKAANEMMSKYRPSLDSKILDERIQANKMVSSYRPIRNALAELVGTHYMGEDA